MFLLLNYNQILFNQKVNTNISSQNFFNCNLNKNIIALTGREPTTNQNKNKKHQIIKICTNKLHYYIIIIAKLCHWAYGPDNIQ